MNEKEYRYRRQLQNAIDYVEENLLEDMRLSDVSASANTSIFHFHRLFRAFTGYSLADYIRDRRMYAAALDLAGTKTRITDIAFNYGYSTPESFLRAFRARYGTNPGAFRKKGIRPPFMAKVNLMETAIGGKKGRFVMNPAIKTLGPLKILGMQISTGHGTCHKDVANFWKRLRLSDSIDIKSVSEDIDAIYGVCRGACDGCSCFGNGGLNEKISNKSFSYFIGYPSKSNYELPAGLSESLIPGGLYAVFQSNAGAVRDAMDWIYSSWLPSSDFELANSPIIEKYNREWQKSEDELMEIWLPIKEGGR